MSKRKKVASRGRRILQDRYPIVAAILLFLSCGVLLLSRCRDSEVVPPEITNVAVLPLTNSTGNPLLAYLTFGFSADIRERLNEVHSLQLASQSEVWSQADETVGLDEVARQLGTELLISGEMSERSGMLKVVIRVYDARHRSPLGSVTQQRHPEQLFELQQRTARDLVSLLGIRLSQGESSRLLVDATRSLKAYDYYLRGLQYLETWEHPRGADFAADLFRQAVQLDPRAARAHADLSEALWRISLRDDDEKALAEARSEATLAYRLDPGLPAARVALARLEPDPGAPSRSKDQKPDQTLREIAADYLRVGKLEKAESSLRAAVRTGSANWRNSYLLGVFFARSGRLREAEAAFEQAARLAPPPISWAQEAVVEVLLAAGDARSAIAAFAAIADDSMVRAETSVGVGRAYLLLDKPEQAESLYRQATVVSPRNHRYRRLLGDVLARLGRVDEAIAQYTSACELIQNELTLTPHDTELQLLATLYAAKAQQCSEALPQATTLRRHLADNAERSLEMALIFALCGERSTTLEALRAAVGFGISPESLRNTKEFDWLADDPEFLEVLATPTTVPPSP